MTRQNQQINQDYPYKVGEYLKQIEKDDFQSWISKFRMEEAKKLLSTSSSLSILDVSSKVGLPNKSPFIADFIKYTGMTPDEWREKARLGL